MSTVYSNKEVTVYGRNVPVCSGCVIVKSELDKAGVTYQYKDTSDSLVYEEMCKLRVRGIPAVFVDGEFKQGADQIKNTIKEILSND